MKTESFIDDTQIFFDVLLIKTIKEFFPEIRIIVAVKSVPIINDAVFVGMNDICENLITTGQSYKD